METIGIDKYTVLIVVLLSTGIQATSVDELLFQSFVTNYSRSYKDEADTMSMKFKVFQVAS